MHERIFMFLKLSSIKTEPNTGAKALLPSTQDFSLFIDGHNNTPPKCESLPL